MVLVVWRDWCVGQRWGASASSPGRGHCGSRFSIIIYCDKRLCGLHKLESGFDEGLRELLDDMAIEDEGMYWCKTCGRDIHVGEYETTEGFKKNGARDITIVIAIRPQSLICPAHSHPCVPPTVIHVT